MLCVGGVVFYERPVPKVKVHIISAFDGGDEPSGGAEQIAAFILDSCHFEMAIILNDRLSVIIDKKDGVV